MERLIERILFASRWLLARLFLGLAALPVLLVLQFGIKWLRLARHFPGTQEQDDLALTPHPNPLPQEGERGRTERH